MVRQRDLLHLRWSVLVIGALSVGGMNHVVGQPDECGPSTCPPSPYLYTNIIPRTTTPDTDAGGGNRHPRHFCPLTDPDDREGHCIAPPTILLCRPKNESSA